MAGKLHEILAVEGGLATTSKKLMVEAHNLFDKKVDHFTERVVQVRHFDAERSVEDVDDTKLMITTVPKKLSFLNKKLARYWDALLTKERANTKAKSSVKIGDVIHDDLPVSFLLQMESKLEEYRRLIDKIPTLPPSGDWVISDTDGSDVYVNENHPKTFKTEKTIQHKVLVEPTEFHPAQITEWSETKNIASRVVYEKSGLLSSKDKADMLDRVDGLIVEFKKARQRANCEIVTHTSLAPKIFAYILGE